MTVLHEVIQEIQRNNTVDGPLPYTSILTEMGSFRYSNTSAKTFLVSAELINHGVEPWRVAQQLFERNTTGQLKLLAERFGGGGHRNAAGCVVKGHVEQVKEKVLPAVEEAIIRAIGKA